VPDVSRHLPDSTNEHVTAAQCSVIELLAVKKGYDYGLLKQ